MLTFYLIHINVACACFIGRGRPPKSSYPVAPAELDQDDDSPPKAKRKSRPPRRHKPDEDATGAQLDSGLPDEMMGDGHPKNILLSALDPSGLPTVENIQKYFSSRGRGISPTKKICFIHSSHTLTAFNKLFIPYLLKLSHILFIYNSFGTNILDLWCTN